LYPSAKYLPVGDNALLVEFGNTVSLDINRRVHVLDHVISEIKPKGLKECVPTYRSLLIYYDPSETSYEPLIFRIKDLEAKLEGSSVYSHERVLEVPVVYGNEYGPDLAYVARYHGLQEDEVIQLHSGRDYTVYMIGFVAGFPYLGEVDGEIATPRLKTPRVRVHAGSVGIAEKQTGIYPCESPGGWRIIGRTPLKFFNIEKRPPALILPGDTVRFKPVEKEEFENLSRDE
jgi:inhibitor of KinA